MSYTPFVYGRTSHESGGQQAFSLAFILLCFLCFFCFLCPVFRIMFWRFWFLLKVTEENSESAAAIRLQHATAKPHKVNLKAITETTRFNYKSRSRVHSGCCETPVYPVHTHTSIRPIILLKWSCNTVQIALILEGLLMFSLSFFLLTQRASVWHS